MPEFADLSIALDQVCYLVVKARQMSVKDAVTEVQPASNPSGDGSAAILEDHAEDPVGKEVTGFIRALNDDQHLDLVTLAIVGREDVGLDEWASLREEAAQADASQMMAELMGTPLLADYLENALAKFEMSCTETEAEHL